MVMSKFAQREGGASTLNSAAHVDSNQAVVVGFLCEEECCLLGFDISRSERVHYRFPNRPWKGVDSASCKQRNIRLRLTREEGDVLLPEVVSRGDPISRCWHISFLS